MANRARTNVYNVKSHPRVLEVSLHLHAPAELRIVLSHSFKTGTCTSHHEVVVLERKSVNPAGAMNVEHDRAGR